MMKRIAATEKTRERLRALLDGRLGTGADRSVLVRLAVHTRRNLSRSRRNEIWTARGYVHGQADQHWLAAEREILAASTPRSPANRHRKRRAGRLHVRRPPRPSRGPAKRRSGLNVAFRRAAWTGVGQGRVTVEAG
jgi:Protein of unknown function (DUF2934)